MTRIDFDRRTFLRAAGAAGIVTIAGCTSDSDDGDTGGNGGDDGGSNGGDDYSYLDDEPGYSDWFDDANNYEGTVDWRDEDEVTVLVGADGGLAYGPAAIAISTGTTVVFEWTGEGGNHDVVERDGAFESELTASAGHTFTHQFDEPGIYEYTCLPHEAVGMKGAVYVE